MGDRVSVRELGKSGKFQKRGQRGRVTEDCPVNAGMGVVVMGIEVEAKRRGGAPVPDMDAGPARIMRSPRNQGNDRDWVARTWRE